MSSWDTNPLSNLCDPHWELICYNKWHPGTSEISTPPNSCRDTLPHAEMALKLPWYLYQLMEKCLGHYFQVWSPYYQVAQCNQKTPIPISSKWKVRSEKIKKVISINTNHSYHQCPSPKSSFNWFNNKARFSFNQPNMKRCGVKLVDVKHLPHRTVLLWHYHWKDGQPRLKRPSVHQLSILFK